MKLEKKKLAGRAVDIADTIVNTVTFIAILLLILIGCYAIWDAEQVYQAASEKHYDIYKPVEDEKSFEELRAINPEVFAWITVYGTHIDYPVVQGEDNIKYVNMSVEGYYSLTGAIFLDADSKSDFSDFSSILYGHNMEKYAMFGEIGEFAKKPFFDERKYGNLYYAGKDHGLEFFAFLHADAYDNSVFKTGIRSKGESSAYLDKLIAMAINTRNVPVTTDDRIVLLSTCSPDSTNGRDILVGRITDEVFEDTFIIDDSGIARAVDMAKQLWDRLPLIAKIIIVGLLLLLILLALHQIVRRVRAKRGPRKDVNGET
jgi:sortase B